MVEVAVIDCVFKDVVRVGYTIIFEPSRVTKSSFSDEIV